MDHNPNILKPDGCNYSSWSYWMRKSIPGVELWELISGSVTKPGPKNQNYTNSLDKWEALNAKSLTLIKDSVDPSIKKRLAIFKSAKEAWDYLARLFAQSTLAEKFGLEKEIRLIKQDERSIYELYCIMTDYWDKLAMMEPIDLSHLDSLIKYREEYRLVQFLWPLRDEFDSLKWSILGRSTLPSVTEALIELIAGEKRLKAGLDACCDVDRMHFADIYWLELDIRRIKQRYKSIQELFNVMSGFWDKLAKLEPNELSNWDSFKKYREEHRLLQFLIALKDDFDHLRTVILHRSAAPSVAEAVSELIAEERRLKSSKHIKSVPVPQSQFSSLSLESGCYLPPHDKGNIISCYGKQTASITEDTGLGTASNTLKILSYNVWFREDLELDNRMEAICDLIQQHSPDVICFQEVTPDIYDIFKQSNWWEVYHCSISDEMAGSGTRPYFCMQLSKLPVKSFSYKPFSNSIMRRELCMTEIEIRGGKQLIIATSHLESPRPGVQMFSEGRVAQAKEALNHLKKFPNVIFCGDMNWDDDLDGHFPLFDGWIDAWTELRPGDYGWTYDTKSNPMLSGNRPLQKRLDRFICQMDDFKLTSIDMIGMKEIPGLSYRKEKVMRKWVRELILPVLPSDHYGLLLKIYSQ